jgi:hypothetical protein
MWTIETEQYYIETNKEAGRGFWATRHTAVKDDGTRLRGSGGRGLDEEYFTYEHGGVSFRFMASRYDRDGKLTDRYEIYLSTFLPKDATLDQARAYARDIREALLALPPIEARHGKEPPTAVTFDMSTWNKEHPDAPVGESFP